MLHLPSEDVPVAGKADLKQRVGRDQDKPSVLGFYAFDFVRYAVVFGLGFMLISVTQRYWRPFEELFWAILSAS